MPRLLTITGLPRSGTAFTATLLALHPETISFHELASYYPDWRTRIIAQPYKFVADSNTYAYLPQAVMDSDKRVYIKHNLNESHKAAQIATNKPIAWELMEAMQSAADTWVRTYSPLVIPRNRVFTVSGCKILWEYCFEGDRFPSDKVRELLKLNIQHHQAHVKYGRNSKFVL